MVEESDVQGRMHDGLAEGITRKFVSMSALENAIIEW